MQNLIFGPPLFYDIPEYLTIVSGHTFWQVFSLGHSPIHPVFLGILWITTRLFPANFTAWIFGIISAVFVYKISKLIFKKGFFWLAPMVFILLPVTWLVNTNLMVESITLTLYILSIYFFLLGKRAGFVISLFLMVGTHLESIFWVPSIFLFPFIFENEIKFNKKIFSSLLKYAIIAIFSSLIFYLLMYTISGRGFEGSGDQVISYFSSGPLRMIRNIWISFIRGFGTLTPFVLTLLLVKNVRTKKSIIAWLVFWGIACLMGANWQGDFMVRRIIFEGVILSLAIYKFLRQKSILIIVYLLPIVTANIILYSKGSPFPLFNLPKDQVLVQSHYLKPFTNYSGTILWIGESDLGKIDGYLESGKRVFLAKAAVTSPYMLMVGNNYHITSLGRIGDSESRFLFGKYRVDLYGNDFEIKLAKTNSVSPQASEPVIFYDQSFWGRLARRRIDYGDVGTWIWAIAVNHRDPTGWTYRDVTGNWVYPI